MDQSEVVKLVNQIREEMTRHFIECAHEKGALDTTLKTLVSDVSGLNKALTKGDGGKSISERLSLLEERVSNLHKKIDSCLSFREASIRARFSFWAPVIASLTTAIGAVLVALLK